MCRSKRRNIFVLHVLSLLAPLSAAVSLADFTPRNDGLPEACNSVYVRQISGCTDTDFTNSACSDTCVNGLVSIQNDVQKACAGLKLDAQSLIGRFLKGDVIPNLCPNFKVTTILPPAPSTQPAPPPPPASTPAPPTTLVTSTPTPTPTPTEQPPSASNTAAPPPASTSGGGDASSSGPIATDANPPPNPTATSIVAVPLPGPTQDVEGTPQLSNPDSGGGSPFDVRIGGALQLSISFSVSLAIPGLVGLIILVII